MSSAEDSSPPRGEAVSSKLHNFPFYEEGKVPQYHKYHSNISYLDELELIWGKRWGAQGIGRLREVAMVRPTETEVRKLYEQDSAFFVFNGTTPDLRLMQEQHLNLARTYEKIGIKVHYSSWSEEIPRSAYGPSRSEWEHSILRVESVRYSITFRHLL